MLQEPSTSAAAITCRALKRRDGSGGPHAGLGTARTAFEKRLAVDPHPYGAGLRSPLDGIYKLTSSHVRVAYHIEEADHEVWVLMIADRRSIWDRHERDILGRLGVMREERRQRQSLDLGKAKGKQR